MINEVVEGAKISFMDRKESDLERKVRKLEQDMMHLDSILNKEKIVRNKSMEREKPPACNPTVPGNYRTFQDDARNMAQGDGPDPWHRMPINIHRNTTSSQVQPTFFFTWDCTPNEFHNNSAQRSIYTLLDQWQPEGQSMSADQFKKQLSALLAANKKSTSTTDLAVKYQEDLDDVSSCEKPGPYTGKPEPDVKKPELITNNPDLDINKSESHLNKPDIETRELLANLEKKLKEVEFKCRDDYIRVLNPHTVNRAKTEEKVADAYGNKTEKNYEENTIIDDLIFDMFKDSNEEFERKPIELAKEVNDLQGLIKSYNYQAGDSMFQNFDSKK